MWSDVPVKLFVVRVCATLVCVCVCVCVVSVGLSFATLPVKDGERPSLLGEMPAILTTIVLHCIAFEGIRGSHGALAFASCWTPKDVYKYIRPLFSLFAFHLSTHQTSSRFCQHKANYLQVISQFFHRICK